jgi:hypothetical protein
MICGACRAGSRQSPESGGDDHMRPLIDQAAIDRLRARAEAEPLDLEIAAKWLKQDYIGYGKWLFDEYGVFVRPCYVCIYTISIQDGVRKAQLSVSSVNQLVTVDLAIVEPIAKAFGLGDHTEWTDIAPPRENQRAYNVIRVIPG